MNYQVELEKMGSQARAAAVSLRRKSARQKNDALAAIAEELLARRDEIRAANVIDLESGAQNDLSQAMLDRLELTPERFDAVVAGINVVKELPDPVGTIERKFEMSQGLSGEKVRVPIGVIGIIYESRPNVTVDAAVLCLKAGNAVILRGGSESIHSNKALAAAMGEGLRKSGFPSTAVQLLPWTDREAVNLLLKLSSYIDVIIPRGGEGLIRLVAENSTIPVIKHYKGVCHIYIDIAADEDMALDIVENAKCQRPGVCNAVETVLIHQGLASSLVPKLASRLLSRNVELRGDSAFCRLVPEAKLAVEDDWYEEYLDMILSVKIVPDIDTAIDHIEYYGSHHSDAIVSNDNDASDKFVRDVDSAVVYVNASTRFTDGAQFGMGAEIGISTDRIHARGPMGLSELTTYKYRVIGNGQIRN